MPRIYGPEGGGAQSGTYVPLSVVDADSDLIVGTGADTVGRLAVPASRIVGRKASGSIAALTPAEVDAIIGRAIARKTADTAITNDSIDDADPHLLFAIAANEVWVVEFFLAFTSPPAADLRFVLGVPAGATFRMNAIVPAEATADVNATNAKFFGGNAVFTAGTDAGTSSGRLAAVVVNGATAGNVVLRWAQGSANAGTTTLLTNSFLIANRQT